MRDWARGSSISACDLGEQLLQQQPLAAGQHAVQRLLGHLQLLFVPAGVGVVQYLGLIGASVVPFLTGLLVSWLAALLVTAGVASALLAVGGARRRRAS